MGTETDLVNVVNRRKLQHFSHEARDCKASAVARFWRQSSTDEEATKSPLLGLYYKQFAHSHE